MPVLETGEEAQEPNLTQPVGSKNSDVNLTPGPSRSVGMVFDLQIL